MVPHSSASWSLICFDTKTLPGPYEQAKTVVENFLVRVVVDYADTQISNSASKYLRENEKVRETVLPLSEGAQKECFMQNKEDENLVTLFLSLN